MRIVLAMTLCVVVSSHALVQAQDRELIPLGPLPGGTSYPTAISNNGQVVGFGLSPSAPQCPNAATYRAISWTATSGMVELPTLGGCISSARAVNARGQVAGESLIAGDVEWHAFYWTAKNGMIDIGTLNPLGCTRACGINVIAITEAGEVIGNSQVEADGLWHVFSWTAQRGMVDLGPGGAIAVNNRGDIIGTDDAAFLGLGYQALLWKR